MLSSQLLSTVAKGPKNISYRRFGYTTYNKRHKHFNKLIITATVSGYYSLYNQYTMLLPDFERDCMCFTFCIHLYFFTQCMLKSSVLIMCWKTVDVGSQGACVGQRQTQREGVKGSSWVTSCVILWLWGNAFLPCLPCTLILGDFETGMVHYFSQGKKKNHA